MTGAARRKYLRAAGWYMARGSVKANGYGLFNDPRWNRVGHYMEEARAERIQMAREVRALKKANGFYYEGRWWHIAFAPGGMSRAEAVAAMVKYQLMAGAILPGVYFYK